MKYKLIKEIDEKLSPIQQILFNRGIQLSEIHHYLNTTDNDICSAEMFGSEVIKSAATVLITAVKEEKDMLVLVDCDCDGYTSAAIFINYLYDLFPAYVDNHLKFFLHENKTHGLSDCLEYIENNDFKLIVIPDAASNDYEYHKKLKEEGRDIIILDHHEAPQVSEDAIVINNQLSNYPNKQLSGAGVVWQFCRYLDTLLGGNNADQYIDLAALGNCGDMMSLKSIETKHIITKGFRSENIKNPFIYGMAEKNSYSLGNKITPIGAAFYIVPFVNSMVRSGTLEEKELLFKSMLKSEAFKEIPSNKRGHAIGEMEKLVDQALRCATNVKNRQTREQDKGMELVVNRIEENNMMEHKVLIFLLEPGQVDPNIAGLIANKIMAKYQRPTLMLTKHITQVDAIDPDENIHYDVVYSGSARGYARSGVDNFKDICEETGLVEYAQGHQNAFGIAIKQENIKDFIAATDEALKDMQSEPVYYVDYIFKGVDVKPETILDIAGLGDIWGQDIDESLICVENLKVTKENLTLMSPDKKPTLKITLPNKLSFIKFGSSQEEYDKLCTEGYVEINIIGKCNANEWNGNVNPQILIEDYEIIGQSKYNF
jgi:single-stranded-DNA-specific exonuclease